MTSGAANKSRFIHNNNCNVGVRALLMINPTAAVHIINSDRCHVYNASLKTRRAVRV